MPSLPAGMDKRMVLDPRCRRGSPASTKCSEPPGALGDAGKGVFMLTNA